MNWIPRNDVDGRCVHHGRSLEYSAHIDVIGIGLGVLTSYSTEVEDCIFTGGGTFHHHWEWGKGGKYTSDKAHVLYSF